VTNYCFSTLLYLQVLLLAALCSASRAATVEVIWTGPPTGIYGQYDVVVSVSTDQGYVYLPFAPNCKGCSMAIDNLPGVIIDYVETEILAADGIHSDVFRPTANVGLNGWTQDGGGNVVVKTRANVAWNLKQRQFRLYNNNSETS